MLSFFRPIELNLLTMQVWFEKNKHLLVWHCTLEYLPAGLASQLLAKCTQRPCLIYIYVQAAVPPHSVRDQCECVPLAFNSLTLLLPLFSQWHCGCCADCEWTQFCCFFKWPLLNFILLGATFSLPLPLTLCFSNSLWVLLLLLLLLSLFVKCLN